ncbi:MAG TPA: polysaccharide biosynthesis/export family protein [Caulobacteraceae bacterium]
MDRRRLIFAAAALSIAFGGSALARGHAAPDAGFPDVGYATWSQDEPAYRLYPDDEIEITFPSAPELNRIVRVQPDGRVAVPLVAPVMAADRTVDQLQDALAAAYASQLRDPRVDVSVKTAGPLKIFVGGEVDKPGVYDMVGDTDALRAIVEAGGFKTSARERQVVIIRRGADGKAMMRVVDLKAALHDPARFDLVPLRRFDIVFVPRSRVAEMGVFVQQYLRDLVPGQVGFNYAAGAAVASTVLP